MRYRCLPFVMVCLAVLPQVGCAQIAARFAESRGDVFDVGARDWRGGGWEGERYGGGSEGAGSVHGGRRGSGGSAGGGLFDWQHCDRGGDDAASAERREFDRQWECG